MDDYNINYFGRMVNQYCYDRLIPYREGIVIIGRKQFELIFSDYKDLEKTFISVRLKFKVIFNEKEDDLFTIVPLDYFNLDIVNFIKEYHKEQIKFEFKINLENKLNEWGK